MSRKLCKYCESGMPRILRHNSVATWLIHVVGKDDFVCTDPTRTVLCETYRPWGNPDRNQGECCADCGMSTTEHPVKILTLAGAPNE